MFVHSSECISGWNLETCNNFVYSRLPFFLEVTKGEARGKRLDIKLKSTTNLQNIFHFQMHRISSPLCSFLWNPQNSYVANFSGRHFSSSNVFEAKLLIQLLPYLINFLFQFSQHLDNRSKNLWETDIKILVLQCFVALDLNTVDQWFSSKVLWVPHRKHMIHKINPDISNRNP